MISVMVGVRTFLATIVFMVRNDMCSLWLEGHFRDDRIEGVGTVTISKNVKARKDEIFMPVTLPQGTIKEVHKAAGFEENGSCIVCWDSQLGRKR